MLTRSWGKALLIAAMILAALLAGAAMLRAAHADEQPATTPAPAEVDQQFARMQEQMRLMQSQMDRLGKTTDPAERQRLLDEHWTAMQKFMADAHGPMMRGHMMGGPMMGGGPMMWKDYRELTPEQLRRRQYMMDRWMPMQQMMMDQMMQHQHGMMQPPAAPPAPPPPKKK